MSTMFDVGGVLLPRPFQIRRVSHIGLNSIDAEAMLRCYRDHLGLRQTDVSEGLANRIDPDGTLLTAPGSRQMQFMRYGGDHHQFVLMHRDLWARADPEHPTVTLNQISWQVGSLAEVAAAIDWLGGEEQRVLRSGRDMPGSNWHTYVLDPDGYTDELTFGMEQIGWDTVSKPFGSWDHLRHRTFPSIPYEPEFAEMRTVADNGVDLGSGFRPDPEPQIYDVDGVRLARPFKIVSHGPFSLVVNDLEVSLRYYRDILGLRLRLRGDHDGVAFAMLSCNTGHHVLALYAPPVREAFGLPAGASVAAVGFQVANYRQLRNAVAYLAEQGYQQLPVPAGLVPGFHTVAHVQDPDGNIIQLYHHMWQGAAVESAPPTRTGPVADWPATVDATPDTFHGEVYMGPWA